MNVLEALSKADAMNANRAGEDFYIRRRAWAESFYLYAPSTHASFTAYSGEDRLPERSGDLGPSDLRAEDWELLRRDEDGVMHKYPGDGASLSNVEVPQP